MAFRADWQPRNSGSLERGWQDGGTLRVTRLVEPKETGKYELEGTKGNKINWEMVPMAELLVERGQIPGDSPATLTGLDAVVHHPNNRWSALILRMCAAALIVDRTTWEPVTCLHMPKGSPDNLPVKKVGSAPDVWEVVFEDVKNPAHEAGFSPDGSFFTMMNNLRQNNMPVFDTSDPDPRRWKKGDVRRGPGVGRRLPQPVPPLFLDGPHQDVRLGAVAEAAQQRRRGGGHQDRGRSSRSSTTSGRIARPCR